MTATTTEVATITPVSHGEAMHLQATELERTIALLRSLDDHDWEARTDCPDWDVRAMFQHVLGACEAGASMRENLHQLRRARAHRRQFGGPLEAALSAVQVSERAISTPQPSFAAWSDRSQNLARANPDAGLRAERRDPEGGWAGTRAMEARLPDRLDLSARHVDAPRRCLPRHRP